MIVSVGPAVGASVVLAVGASVVAVGEAVGSAVGDDDTGAGVSASVSFSDVGEAVGSTVEPGEAVGVTAATVEHTHLATAKTVAPSGLTKTPSCGNPLASAVSPSTTILVMLRGGSVGKFSDL